MNKKIILTIMICLLLLGVTTGCCQRDREDPIYIICRIWYPQRFDSQVERLPTISLQEQIGPAQQTAGDYSSP